MKNEFWENKPFSSCLSPLLWIFLQNLSYKMSWFGLYKNEHMRKLISIWVLPPTSHSTPHFEVGGKVAWSLVGWARALAVVFLGNTEYRYWRTVRTTWQKGRMSSNTPRRHVYAMETWLLRSIDRNRL